MPVSGAVLVLRETRALDSDLGGGPDGTEGLGGVLNCVECDRGGL